ncbi:uncharacterized protein [Oscarella lobularis]|uniref:uncharacterized protein isoform X2 n=1 Tax=Oscarella lobularis TaxID=121494 RepID=UPI003313A79B
MPVEQWLEVRSKIEKKVVDQWEGSQITLSRGIQIQNDLKHPYPIKSLSVTNPSFEKKGMYRCLAHYGSQSTNWLSVWQIGPKIKQTNSKLKMSSRLAQLLYIPRKYLPVYVGFFEDLYLRVYNSLFKEICSIEVRNTVLCSAYSERCDELITGGVGFILAWTFEFEQKVKDVFQQGKEIEHSVGPHQWVVHLTIDEESHSLVATEHDGVHIIDLATKKEVQMLRNKHLLSLTCSAFSSRLGVLITASKDGAIKVWNSAVHRLLHEFSDHLESITGLVFHHTESLLFSSSTDCSIRVWRLDTYEEYYRYDALHAISNLNLIDEHHLCYTSKNSVLACSFNQYEHLFAVLYSSVLKVQRVKVPGVKNPRIVIRTHDGAVRLISPVSGTTLTTVFPIVNVEALECVQYDIRDDVLFVLLRGGRILLIDSETNPCSAMQLWNPVSYDDVFLSIALLDTALMDGFTNKCSFLFAGHMTGMISLIYAGISTAFSPTKAHQGKVVELQGSSVSSSSGIGQCLVSMGSDKTICIWKLEKLGKSEKAVYLNQLQKLCLESLPRHIAVMNSTLCIVKEDNSLEMFPRFEQDKSEQSKHKEQHDQRGGQVLSLSCCPTLGLFATSSSQGNIKVWDSDNTLVRKISLNSTLSAVGFCNERGDLLVGCDGHLSLISVCVYLPSSYLRKLLGMDFDDDVNEPPISFDPELDFWYDSEKISTINVQAENHAVLQLPTERKKSRKKKAESHANIQIVPKPKGSPLTVKQRESLKKIVAVSEAKTNRERMKTPAGRARRGGREEEKEGEEEEEEDFRTASAVAASVSAHRSPLPRVKSRKPSIKPLLVPRFGHIPNSIVRRMMGMMKKEKKKKAKGLLRSISSLVLEREREEAAAAAAAEALADDEADETKEKVPTALQKIIDLWGKRSHKREESKAELDLPSFHLSEMPKLPSFRGLSDLEAKLAALAENQTTSIPPSSPPPTPPYSPSESRSLWTNARRATRLKPRIAPSLSFKRRLVSNVPHLIIKPTTSDEEGEKPEMEAEETEGEEEEQIEDEEAIVGVVEEEEEETAVDENHSGEIGPVEEEEEKEESSAKVPSVEKKGRKGTSVPPRSGGKIILKREKKPRKERTIVKRKRFEFKQPNEGDEEEEENLLVEEFFASAVSHLEEDIKTSTFTDSKVHVKRMDLNPVPPTISQLILHLNNSDAEIRRRAAEALKLKGSNSHHIILSLASKLDDPDGSVQREVWRALMRLTKIKNRRELSRLLARLYRRPTTIERGSSTEIDNEVLDKLAKRRATISSFDADEDRMTAWLRSVSPSLRPTDESDDESSDENEVSTDDVGDSARSTPQLSSNRTTTPRNLKKLRCITWPQKSAIPFVRERAASKAAEERSASLQVRLRRGQRKIEERRAAAAGEDSRPVVQSHVNLSKEIPNKDIKTPYRVKLREDEEEKLLSTEKEGDDSESNGTAAVPNSSRADGETSEEQSFHEMTRTESLPSLSTRRRTTFVPVDDEVYRGITVYGKALIANLGERRFSRLNPLPPIASSHIDNSEIDYDDGDGFRQQMNEYRKSVFSSMAASLRQLKQSFPELCRVESLPDMSRKTSFKDEARIFPQGLGVVGKTALFSYKKLQKLLEKKGESMIGSPIIIPNDETKEIVDTEDVALASALDGDGGTSQEELPGRDFTVKKVKLQFPSPSPKLRVSPPSQRQRTSPPSRGGKRESGSQRRVSVYHHRKTSSAEPSYIGNLSPSDEDFSQPVVAHGQHYRYPRFSITGERFSVDLTNTNNIFGRVLDKTGRPLPAIASGQEALFEEDDTLDYSTTDASTAAAADSLATTDLNSTEARFEAIDDDKTIEFYHSRKSDALSHLTLGTSKPRRSLPVDSEIKETYAREDVRRRKFSTNAGSVNKRRDYRSNLGALGTLETLAENSSNYTLVETANTSDLPALGDYSRGVALETSTPGRECDDNRETNKKKKSNLIVDLRRGSARFVTATEATRAAFPSPAEFSVDPSAARKLAIGHEDATRTSSAPSKPDRQEVYYQYQQSQHVAESLPTTAFDFSRLAGGVRKEEWLSDSERPSEGKLGRPKRPLKPRLKLVKQTLCPPPLHTFLQYSDIESNRRFYHTVYGMRLSHGADELTKRSCTTRPLTGATITDGLMAVPNTPAARFERESQFNYALRNCVYGERIFRDVTTCSAPKSQLVRQRVEPLPAMLTFHTHSRQKGVTDYGILRLEWFAKSSWNSAGDSVKNQLDAERRKQIRTKYAETFLRLYIQSLHRRRGRARRLLEDYFVLHDFPELVIKNGRSVNRGINPIGKVIGKRSRFRKMSSASSRRRRKFATTAL